MATKPKITEKEYRKTVKLIKDINKTFGNDKSAISLIKKANKTITKFEKQNKYYNDYKKLNSKFNALRYRANKQSNDFDLISNQFKGALNPFLKKKDIPPIKYNGKKTIKNLEININALQEIWKANDLTPYGKHNNIKFLIHMAFEKDNFFDFLPSAAKREIQLDELAHNSGETGYQSKLRILNGLNKFYEIASHNPQKYNVTPEQIRKYTKSFLKKRDKTNPDDKLYKLFLELESKGEL